jgi:hypothetical protein
VGGFTAAVGSTAPLRAALLAALGVGVWLAVRARSNHAGALLRASSSGGLLKGRRQRSYRPSNPSRRRCLSVASGMGMVLVVSSGHREGHTAPEVLYPRMERVTARAWARYFLTTRTPPSLR